MAIYSCQNHKINIALILFITFIFPSFLFAQQESIPSADDTGDRPSNNVAKPKKGTAISREKKGPARPQEEGNLTSLQRTARIYRSQGYELQRTGNVDGALVLYQKAIELDPEYQVAYNDLGVIYEAKGELSRAETNYLKAIKVDPVFLSAYTNLAIFYENKRDLEKARFYWQKRAQLGLPDDPWTAKARQRLEDIGLVLSVRPFEDMREKEVVGLLKDVENEKIILRRDEKVLSDKHFQKAKESYNKDDYATSIQEALDAQQLNPSNKEIDKFIAKVQLRALSK